MKLTPRQVAIIRGISLGKPRKEIAADLGITVKALEWHICGQGVFSKNIYQHLGFSDPARLTHWAIRHRLVKLGEPLR